MLSWPNRITIVRLLLVTPFVLLLLHAGEDPMYRYAALGLAGLMGVSDAADGIIARRTGSTTRIGAILDPLADKALMISALVLLSLPRVMPDADLRLPPLVSVTLVSRDLFILVGSAAVYLLAGSFHGQPSVAGKAATVSQVVMILVTLASPDFAARWPAATFYGLRGVWGVTVGLGIISWLGYIRTGSRLVASSGEAR